MTTELFPNETLERWATLSEDGLYRWTLGRRWSQGPAEDVAGRRLLWCMLNPSIADAFLLDNTLRKCIKYAKREGCGGVELVNLFGLRSKDPRDLGKVTDPVGPENDQAIADAIDGAAMVVCGWGNHGRRWQRDEAVLAMLEAAAVPTYCLLINANGTPGHPLYLDDEDPFLRYDRGCLV